MPLHEHELIHQLLEPNASKIVLLVADGLGGLPMEPGGKTELETAGTPNLDRLTVEGTVGLSTPVYPGVAPGSGPGHLGLFGYDPLEYQIGRGVLEALGIGVEVGARDVAIRGNFCTIDAEGKVTDRRAGRIPTETCVKLVEKLRRGKDRRGRDPDRARARVSPGRPVPRRGVGGQGRRHRPGLGRPSHSRADGRRR